MKPASSHRILMVDDEPHILAGFQRTIGRRFPLTCVESGTAALALLQKGETFSVIVTDMRMPGMNGVELLSRISEMRLDTVRLMLTGNADQQTAVDAINKGHIARFLNKPCQPEVLESAIMESIHKFEVANAERILLRDTVSGAIRLLLGAIELSNPRLAEAQSLIKSYSKELLGHLGIHNDWQIPMASQLSLFGLVTVPGLKKEDILSEESVSIAALIGGELLANIPRLGTVANMVSRQHEYGPLPEVPDAKSSIVVTGARILRLAVDLSREYLKSGNRAAAVAAVSANKRHDQQLLAAFQRPTPAPVVEPGQQRLTLIQLSPGMVLAEDIYSKEEVLLFSLGQELTPVAIASLRNQARSGSISKDIRIAIYPAVEPADQLDEQQGRSSNAA